uniref:VWFA domain-containing protein n=1 Tax=Biomphalaria glabrata TaxID=6526 RepID=A0A2C9KUB7_BIOGL
MICRHLSFTLRIGAFGYSGSQSVQILPYWTSPDKAGSKLWKLRALSSAESRTYSGLKSVVTEAKYKENLLIVVTAQGSNNDLLRNKSLAEVDRVKSLGWNLKVIAVKGSSPLDVAELSRLDSNYITLSDRPKSYTGLSRELIRVIDTMCSGRVNPRATTTCKPKAGGGRHKHDSSSEEEY